MYPYAYRQSDPSHSVVKFQMRKMSIINPTTNQCVTLAVTKMGIWQFEHVIANGILWTSYNRAFMVIAEKTACFMNIHTCTHTSISTYLIKYIQT